ncbi:MAG: phosphoribosylglycinamide formyltransferase [Porticoccaceae bacterium]
MGISRPRLVILISGTGSNMEALIRASRAAEIAADVVAVLSNKPGAGGLATARDAGIATEVVDHREFPDRESFDRELAARIEAQAPDLVILAGFMRILTPGFVRRFHGRLINIHPSLLPKYPGLHTHQRAIDSGDAEAGATVHFVTEELDGGPAIVQARVPVVAGDTADSLAARVLATEHRLYPYAVQLLCSGRLTLEAQGAALDGQLLPPQGLIFTEQ